MDTIEQIEKEAESRYQQSGRYDVYLKAIFQILVFAVKHMLAVNVPAQTPHQEVTRAPGNTAPGGYRKAPDARTGRKA